MSSFRYVSDISGYTVVLYHPKTVQLHKARKFSPQTLCERPHEKSGLELKELGKKFDI